MSKKPFLSSEETERRLRPAMSSLSAHNPRQALRQASKHLPHPSAIAIYSVALLRLGRIDEAEAFVGREWPKALAAINGDAAHKIGMFWRELRRLDKVGEGFLKAWELDKGPEMGEMAFISELASENWGAAGRIAAKLQKMDGQRGLWGALAAYMHGVTQADGGKLLGLSSAMVKRRFAESRRIKADEARFCVRVLKAAGEWKVAREVLQKTEGLEEMEKKLEEASILEGECRREEAQHAYEVLIEKDPEDWDCWLRWMRLHGDPREILAQKSILTTFLRKHDLESSAQSEMRKLSENENTSFGLDSKAYRRRTRAVHLAEIEALKRCGLFEEMYDKCIQYFRMFCTYPICAQDLRPYFLDLIASHPSVSSRSIIARLSSSAGADLSPDVSSVLSLLKMWLPEIPREHKFVTPFEAPSFYLFTAHSLIRASPASDKGDTVHSEYVSSIKATLTLEEGLSRYPSDMFLSLALLQLYLEIGAVGPCIKLFKSLEIKFVQLCSLHYLVLPRSVLLCPCSKVVNEEVLTPIFELQRRQWKDYFLALHSALQNGYINSATDTVFFQRRLSKSEAFARAIIARASRFISESLFCLCSDSSEIPLNSLSIVERDLLYLQTAVEELIDNRDLEIMTFWSSNAYEPRNRELELDRRDTGEEVQGKKLNKLQRAELAYYTACLCKVVERLGDKLRMLEQERTSSTKEKKAGKKRTGKREGKKKSARTKAVPSKKRDAEMAEEKLSLAVECVKLSESSLKLPRDSYMESLTNLIDQPDSEVVERKCCDHLITTSRRLRTTVGIYTEAEEASDGEKSTSPPQEKLRYINGCRLHELGKFIYETIQWTVVLICSCEASHEQLQKVVAKTIANLEPILKQAVASSPNPLFKSMTASSESDHTLDRGMVSMDSIPGTPNEQQIGNTMTFRARVLTEIEKSQRESITRMLECLQAANKCLRKVK